MKKVTRKYNDDLKPFIIKVAQRGIGIYECDDIYMSDLKKEEVKNIIQQYELNDEDTSCLKEYFNLKDIEWNYIQDGYFTYDEFINKYDDEIIITSCDEALTVQDYYESYERIFFYSYQDGSNYRDIELGDEGNDVIFIDTLEKRDTYTIDLYYDIDDKEFFTTSNSLYQGTLIDVEEVLDNKEVKEEYLNIVKDVTELLEKIDFEIRHNNKLNQKDEGFKVCVELTEEEFETFEYIENLYDYCEREENELFIENNYI